MGTNAGLRLRVPVMAVEQQVMLFSISQAYFQANGRVIAEQFHVAC